ncbi:hypothetical protein HY251_03090 [bacterium]|nr:hypothetical protein [bacterium]
MERARLHLALVEPVIPQNTGNIGRIALAFGLRLHLVGPLGFSIEEKACRRAGLDYWKHVDLARWDDLASLERSLEGSTLWIFSAHGKTSVTEAPFREGDVLVFGNEATGLPREQVLAAGERSVRIPIASPRVRSLNLANAVSIGAYEALRRLGLRDVPPDAGSDADQDDAVPIDARPTREGTEAPSAQDRSDRSHARQRRAGSRGNAGGHPPANGENTNRPLDATPPPETAEAPSAQDRSGRSHARQRRAGSRGNAGGHPPADGEKTAFSGELERGQRCARSS